MDFKHTDLDIENEYPKLVRDKIPQIIKEKEGIDASVKILTEDGEFLKYLLVKLVEEAEELRHTVEEGILEEELADIFEICDAILKLKRLTHDDVAAVQKEKRDKRGGFEKRMLMLKKP